MGLLESFAWPMAQALSMPPWLKLYPCPTGLAGIAQLVEQATENRRVPSSNLGPGMGTYEACYRALSR